MRLRIYFMLSFLLITVGTSPIEPQDPNSWETYGIWRDAPRFPPPDIGPPVLPKGHLDDYPHLSRSQKSWIRQKTFKEHKRHQKEILEQWRKTGSLPTDQELKKRAKEIENFIKELAEGYTDDYSTRIMRQKKRIQTRIKGIERARASEPYDLKIIQESEQEIRNIEASRQEYKKEIERVTKQIRDLRADQSAFTRESLQYDDFEPRIQELRAKWQELSRQRDQTRSGITLPKNKIKKANTRRKSREKEIKKLEEELQVMTKQLEEMERSGSKTQHAKTDHKSDSVAQDQNQDGNHFSKTGLENGPRRWMQGIGGLIQDVNHRLSTGGRGNVHPQPFAGGLPKLGLVGVP